MMCGSCTDAEEVVDRGITELYNHTLTASWPDPPPRYSSEEDLPDPSCMATVVVEGITSKLSRDALKLYFQNTDKSGGGRTQNFEVCGKRAFITYCSPEGKSLVHDLKPVCLACDKYSCIACKYHNSLVVGSHQKMEKILSKTSGNRNLNI